MFDFGWRFTSKKQPNFPGFHGIKRLCSRDRKCLILRGTCILADLNQNYENTDNSSLSQGIEAKKWLDLSSAPVTDSTQACPRLAGSRSLPVMESGRGSEVGSERVRRRRRTPCWQEGGDEKRGKRGGGRRNDRRNYWGITGISWTAMMESLSLSLSLVILM